jgi:hypothetical protein
MIHSLLAEDTVTLLLLSLESACPVPQGMAACDANLGRTQEEGSS